MSAESPGAGDRSAVSDSGFGLIETLRYEPAAGFVRVDAHLARLATSAQVFGLPCDATRARQSLFDARPAGTARVRLLLNAGGQLTVTSTPLHPDGDTLPRTVRLAAEPHDPDLLWLRHKTTRREVYDAAHASRGDAGTVLLHNTRGELSESVIASVAVRLDGAWFTPPLSAGLLPGVMRATLLARGHLRERTIRIAELQRAEGLQLMNSVRGLWSVRLID